MKQKCEGSDWAQTSIKFSENDFLSDEIKTNNFFGNQLAFGINVMAMVFGLATIGLTVFYQGHLDTALVKRWNDRDPWFWSFSCFSPHSQ